MLAQHSRPCAASSPLASSNRTTRACPAAPLLPRRLPRRRRDESDSKRASTSSSIVTAATSSSSSSPLPSTSTTTTTPRLAADGLPPLRVVVTGGSRGIGRALVEEFLRAGDDVALCSRSASSVEQAERELRAKFSSSSSSPSSPVIFAAPCDVSKPGEARAFASRAAEALGGGGGRIDVWINNAGMSTWGSLAAASDGDGGGDGGGDAKSTSSGSGGRETFADVCDEEEIATVVATNVTGTILGTRAAILQFLKQENGDGGGHVFNMDGAGSEGGPTPFFSAYGATKHALSQFHKSAKAELKELGLQDRVGIHRISPGMVTTDLLMKGTGRPRAKFFVNVLAEEPADSASFLVPRIRAIARKPGPPSSGPDAPSAAFLTPFKAFSQLAARVLTGARKDRFIVEE